MLFLWPFHWCHCLSKVLRFTVKSWWDNTFWFFHICFVLLLLFMTSWNWGVFCGCITCNVQQGEADTGDKLALVQKGWWVGLVREADEISPHVLKKMYCFKQDNSNLSAIFTIKRNKPAVHGNPCSNGWIGDFCVPISLYLNRTWFSY